MKTAEKKLLGKVGENVNTYVIYYKIFSYLEQGLVHKVNHSAQN